MQILKAAHLFLQLIGYEFYRNDRISNLSVITGGTQINSTVDANVEVFANLSCRFTHTWLMLASAHRKFVTRSQHQKGHQLKDYGGRQSWSCFQRTVKRKELGVVLVESGPSKSEIHSYS